jgi:tRNA threonylcarbamoyladenosine biosynthesis protein TsaE
MAKAFIRQTATLEDLVHIVHPVGCELKWGDIVSLEGELGTGKSTFASLLLKERFNLASQGSPSFPIVCEYQGVCHIDLYRLKNEDEFLERGLLDLFYDVDRICLVEWFSLWPKQLAFLKNRKRVWEIHLRFAQSPESRLIEVFSPNPIPEVLR